MQGLNKDDEYIDEIKTKIFYAKKRYFAHQTDRGIYEDIEQLRYFGNIIIELKEERIKDTILNDTCTVNKIDKEIKISSARKINNFVSLSPFIAKNKVVI